MTCVYETNAHSDSGNDFLLYSIVKQRLSDELQCAIIEDTANKLVHKIPVLDQYDAESGKGIPVLVRHMDKPTSIATESILLQNLNKPINIKRIYVEKSYAPQAKRIVRELLKVRGEDNGYRVPNK
jgi:hypothetical protein